MPVVDQVTVRGFRNLAEGGWSPDRGRQLILGPNGAGKTSWLEAIYLLATTRSFRTPRLAVCRAHGSSRFDLSAEISGERRSRLSVSWSSDEASRAKLDRRLNGSVVPTAEYLGALPVVAWSSNGADVISGSPGDRRRFLDQGLVAERPALFESISRYRQALAQKRVVLREGRFSELETWNAVLAPLVAEIVRERARHADALDRQIARLFAAIPGASFGVGLSYRPSVAFEGEGTASEALERLESVREQEVERRRPTAGPHRDDLEIRWRGHPAALVASAGERKLLALALYAARGRLLEAVDRSPIYLLDDLDTELDAGRLQIVWQLFPDRSQIFVSSNRASVWEGLELGRIWRLEGGSSPAESTSPIAL